MFAILSSLVLSLLSQGAARVLKITILSLGQACADQRCLHFPTKRLSHSLGIWEPPGWLLHSHKGNWPTHWCGHCVPLGRQNGLGLLIHHVADITVTQQFKKRFSCIISIITETEYSYFVSVPSVSSLDLFCSPFHPACGLNTPLFCFMCCFVILNLWFMCETKNTIVLFLILAPFA